MTRLWAPWRAAYVGGSQPEGCLFCRLAAEEPGEANLVLERAATSYLMLNAYPYNAGHVMAVPLRHIPDLDGLDDAERADLLAAAARAVRALQRAYGPDGYNLGMNMGRAAGAGITDHVHLHVVPRWTGDTNFLPVLGETKVIPEDLATTYARLRAALASLGGSR